MLFINHCLNIGWSYMKTFSDRVYESGHIASGMAWPTLCREYGAGTERTDAQSRDRGSNE
jgi:hypothetical protein